MGKTSVKEETEPIEQPQLLPNGMLRFEFQISPAMYRNMVRASKKMMGRIDMAAVARMFLKKGIYEILPGEEHEAD